MRTASFLALLALLLFAACDSGDTDTEDADPNVAQANSTVTVAYEGRLEDGTVFDQNDRATFDLQRVLIGFREGVVGMEVGETKTFTIPPEDAYGEEGVTNPDTGEVIIPPNATLIFEVTLLDVL